jgi:hypothetical protein
LRILSPEKLHEILRDPSVHLDAAHASNPSRDIYFLAGGFDLAKITDAINKYCAGPSLLSELGEK